MFVKLHRIHEDRGNFYLTEVVINISHISYMKENRSLRVALSEGKLNIGINPSAEFTDIMMSDAKNGSSVISVVGSIGAIESKIHRGTKMLLRD